MKLEQLKKLKLNDLLVIDASKYGREEVAYIEKRLVKEANRRLTRLKQAGKLSQAKITKTERKGFTSYKPPKGYKPKEEGSNKYIVPNTRKKAIDLRNKKAQNVTKIQKFLEKKTTRVREINVQAERYRDVIRKTLGNSKLKISDRQLKRISKLMSKAEELAGLDSTTKKTSGSPRLLNVIVDIVKNRKYIKNDDAEEIIKEAVTGGYENAQRLLNKLNEEDSEEVTIDDYDDEYPYY